MKNHYSKEATEVLHDLNVGSKGLSSDEVTKRREQFGLNELQEGEKPSLIKIFLEQFKDLLVFILIGASIISAAMGNLESTIVILVVITINAILGTVQHIKAEQSLNSLKALSSPIAKVIRDGEKIQIPSNEVVPGDILLLEAGDYVPADGRIIENFSLQVNESSLTGESESVIKTDEKIDKDSLPLGDQKNMVFSGSLVTYGRAQVVVTATAMNTEIGKIAALIKGAKEKKTPLQVSLDNFGKNLAIGIIVVSMAVFMVNLYRGVDMMESLMFAVALAVAAIPEALSSIVTIVLAIGTQDMAKENAIIRKLKAVESLGSISVICSDKTGTLTQNKMTVKKVYVGSEIVEEDKLDENKYLHKKIMSMSALCNDSTSVDGNEIGDPTEVALVKLIQKYGWNELSLRSKYNRLKEIPFDSDRKLMSTLHFIEDKYTMITKGALDVMLDRTSFIEDENGVRPITEKDIKNIKKTNESLSKKGLRVLCFGYKTIDELDAQRDLTLEDENRYTFIGLIAMIDPPREESKAAVEACIRAGIKPVMITGDHRITASAIAKEIGILKDDSEAIDGVALDSMSDEDLMDKVESLSVYARVSPEHKIRIVRAWQNKGNVVAMTGDGVNDAPALKQSDIGIAMGITGTEVAKDSASVILTDDNFATIVKAIANGRNIYNNIKNSIKFLLSGNTAAIIAVLFTSLMGMPMPFAPVHLLFINLLTDSLPAIALGMEEGKDNIMNEKPRNINEPILSKSFITEVIVQGAIISVVTLGAFHIGLKTGNELLASTMAFATLCMSRLFHGFNCRGKQSIFKIGVFKNRFVWLAFLIGAVLLNAVLFITPLHSIFSVAELSLNNYLEIYTLSILPVLLIQGFKHFFVKDTNENEMIVKKVNINTK